MKSLFGRGKEYLTSQTDALKGQLQNGTTKIREGMNQIQPLSEDLGGIQNLQNGVEEKYRQTVNNLQQERDDLIKGKRENILANGGESFKSKASKMPGTLENFQVPDEEVIQLTGMSVASINGEYSQAKDAFKREADTTQKMDARKCKQEIPTAIEAQYVDPRDLIAAGNWLQPKKNVRSSPTDTNFRHLSNNTMFSVIVNSNQDLHVKDPGEAYSTVQNDNLRSSRHTTKVNGIVNNGFENLNGHLEDIRQGGSRQVVSNAVKQVTPFKRVDVNTNAKRKVDASKGNGGTSKNGFDADLSTESIDGKFTRTKGSVQKGLALLPGGINKENLIQRGERFRTSAVSKLGNKASGIFAISGKVTNLGDAERLDSVAQGGISSIGAYGQTVREVPNEAFRRVKSGFTPEAIKQQAFTFLSSNTDSTASKSDGATPKNAADTTKDLQPPIGNDFPGTGFISGFPTTAISDKYNQAKTTLQTGVDMRHKLNKDNLIQRGQSFRASHIDPQVGQIGSRFSGIFGLGGQAASSVETQKATSTPNKGAQNDFNVISNYKQTVQEAPTKAFENMKANFSTDNLRQKGFGLFAPKTGQESSATTSQSEGENTTQNRQGSIGYDFPGGFISGFPTAAISDTYNQAKNTVQTGVDMRHKLNKDNLIQRGQSFRASHIDPQVGQVGTRFSGIFGFGGQASSSVETPPSTSTPKIGAQNDFTVLRNYKQSVQEAPTKAFENVSTNFNTDRLRQKGLGLFALEVSREASTSEGKSVSASATDVDGSQPTGIHQHGIGLISSKTGITESKIQEKTQSITAFGPSLGRLGDTKDSSGGKFERGQKNGESNRVNTGLTGVLGLIKSKTEEVDDAEANVDGEGSWVKYEDTRGPSCIYTVGTVVRLALIVANALTIVRVVTVSNVHWNWGLAPVCSIFMALEYAVVVFKRWGKEWTWWVPSVLIYIITTLPLIWQLQLNNLRKDTGTQTNSDVWTIVACDAVVYLTIFSRWILQGGVVTLMSLAAVLLDFIANASDIMDLLSLTDQPVVRSNRMLMYWVLTAWSVSFIKFIPLIDIGTNDEEQQQKKKELPTAILNCCGPMFTEFAQILFSLILLDGSFLVIRVYLLIGEGVVTFGLVFFIVKNVLAFSTQLYRLIVLCRAMPCSQKKTDE